MVMVHLGHLCPLQISGQQEITMIAQYDIDRFDGCTTLMYIDP